MTVACFSSDTLTGIRTPRERPAARAERVGVVLEGRGGHDRGRHRQPGRIDCDHPLGAQGAAVRAALVMKGGPAVRGAPRQVGVDLPKSAGR